jgi:hypothetical protein
MGPDSIQILMLEHGEHIPHFSLGKASLQGSRGDRNHPAEVGAGAKALAPSDDEAV